LTYIENEEWAQLTSEDVNVLPQVFPVLKTFKIQSRGSCHTCSTNDCDTNGGKDLTAVIAKRSPNLKNIEFIGVSASSSTIRGLPKILSKRNSRPSLKIDAVFELVTEYPSHLQFLVELNSIEFKNLRQINMKLQSPTSSVVSAVNQCLSLNSGVLEWLVVFCYGPWDSDEYPILIIPVLPKLEFLKLLLSGWTMSQVSPNPITASHFPELTRLTSKITTNLMTSETEEVCILGSK